MNRKEIGKICVYAFLMNKLDLKRAPSMKGQKVIKNIFSVAYSLILKL